jgi:hypothetical protein
MAYGFHPQLYPYLYAPKNPLGLSSGYEHSSSDHSTSPHHKPSMNKDHDEKSLNEEISSKTTDEECTIDESENVEID